MPSESVNKAILLDRIQALKDAGAVIGLLVTGPPNGKALFDLTVRILNVQAVGGDCLLAFTWQTDTGDCRPNRSFAHSDGTLVISLEGATFRVDRQPEKLLISRGPFSCTLTVIRATAF